MKPLRLLLCSAVTIGLLWVPLASAQVERLSDCEMASMLEMASFRAVQNKQKGMTYGDQVKMTFHISAELAGSYGNSAADTYSQIHTGNLKALYFDAQFAHTTPQKYMDLTTKNISKFITCPTH